MTRQTRLRHEFVEAVPDELEDGVLYVSMLFATAVHRCCCGCGSEVVTPFSPTDWSLTFDGRSVSLSPSIGNWSFACRSHYWIDKGGVRWAGQWSPGEVTAGRRRDALAKERQFADEGGAAGAAVKHAESIEEVEAFGEEVVGEEVVGEEVVGEEAVDAVGEEAGVPAVNDAAAAGTAAPGASRSRVRRAASGLIERIRRRRA